MMLPASYHTGFVPRDGYPAYPELWRGCVGAWAPCLGPTGLTLRDWSGRQNHGTLTNMDAATDWVVSSGRYGLEFDGNDTAGNNAVQNRVEIPRDYAADTIVFSAWINPIALNKRGICTSGPLYTNPRFAITLLTTGQLEVYRGANTTSTASVIANTWSHIYVSSTGQDTSFWINGVFSNTASQTISPSLQTIFLLGNNYWGALEGYLDDARIYNRLLSSAEIRLLASRRGIAYEMYRPTYYTPPISARRRKILTGQV